MGRRLLLVLALALTTACGSSTPLYEMVTAEHGAVRIARARVDDGRVHFFTYRTATTNVNFLVRRDAHGTLHTHLDACYSCYRYHRGFIVNDGALLCVACRYAYALADEEWDYIGACAPIAIHCRTTPDTVVIQEKLLERAARYF